MKKFAIILIYLLSFPAQAIEFRIPLDCDFGKDCFIQNYVDESATPPDYKDYKCGPMTYPHHTGTDFRLPDFAKMQEGVDVVAAASGKVERVRDGVEDISVKKIDPEKIKDIACGNAVVIGHGDGWETIYCHMKHGSVAVKPGQKVKQGEKLGEVGLSGDTEFPHVHFEVHHNGNIIDPFTGAEAGFGCNINSSLDNSLWNARAREKLSYKQASLLSAGFADAAPSEEDARNGKYKNLKFPPDAKIMAFWADIMGIEKDDELLMQVIAPDGKPILSKQQHFPENEALEFYYIASPLMMNSWLPGTYEGKVTLFRKEGNNFTPIFSETYDMIVGN